MIKTAFFVTAAALATLAVAAPAVAQQTAETATTRNVLVHYGDLDLTSVKDQKVLARRIDRAARNACDLQYGRLNSADAMTCYRRAHAAGRTRMAAVIGDAQLGG